MKTKLITLALAILVVLGVTGCAKKEASIYGKWQAVIGEGDLSIITTIEFKENEMITNSIFLGMEGEPEVRKVSYSNDGDTWTITDLDSQLEPLVITISDDSFTVTEDGISLTFNRV